MKVKPMKTIHVPERISMLDMLNVQARYVIDGQAKAHYVLDKDFEIENQFETECERYSLSCIHPQKPWVAVMGKDGRLHVAGLDGKDLWSRQGDYIAVCWALAKDVLYTLVRVDSNTLKLIVYDHAGEICAQREFEDELYESSAFITSVPNSEDMTLQLMAGQDGCMTYFVKCYGADVAMKLLHDHASYTCVSFNREGSRFLCIENDESAIYHFTYPGLEEIGKISFDVEKGNLDYTLIYLDNRAVVRYCDNFFLLDTKTMQIAEELIIVGHEPVPVYELYKNLKHDSLMCDISYLCSAGDFILGHANKCTSSELVVIKKADIKSQKEGRRDQETAVLA